MVYSGEPWTREQQQAMAARLAALVERRVINDGDRTDAAFDLALSRANTASQRAHLQALYDQFEAVQMIQQAQLDALSGGGEAAVVALREALANEY